MNITTSFNITCPPYPADTFESGQRIVLVDHDSYKRLLALLTDEQRAANYENATSGLFTAISGRIA